MFKKGQKVVCINDTPKPGRPQAINHPKKNNIYTIRDIYVPVTDPSRLALLLEEITSSISNKFRKEVGFDANRFKPIDMIDDSVEWAESILSEILLPEESNVCLN